MEHLPAKDKPKEAGETPLDPHKPYKVPPPVPGGTRWIEESPPTADEEKR